MIVDPIIPSPVPGFDFLARRDDSILYLGEGHDGQGMWLTPGQVRTHALVVGTTGSGKTELIASLMTNAMAWGSGSIIVDGKGDVSLLAKAHAIATSLGRSDDMYVLNFMGGKASGSHTVNPLLRMDAIAITNLVVGLMDKPGRDGEMWKSRAISLISAVIEPMVWLRDNLDERLSFSTLRSRITLRGVESIVGDKRIPEHARRAANAYLATLPGYVSGKTSQSSVTSDQHGYLSMQFTRIFGSLCDDFGYIFTDEIPDVDIEDIIKGRRIVIILLPTLSKSSSEVANLGRIIVAMIKSAMAGMLPSGIEGSWESIVEGRYGNVGTPFLCIFDEVGHYMTDGMGAMAAQARSLNFGLVFSSQNIEVMRQANHSETAGIIANTNTKILMKSTDTSDYDIVKMCQHISDYQMAAELSNSGMSGARNGLNRARLELGALISSDRRRGTRELAEAIIRGHEEDLERNRTKSNVSLPHRLQYLESGEMLVLADGRAKFGRSMFIPVSSSGHRVELGRFLSPAPYVGHAMESERAAAEKLRQMKEVAALADRVHSVPTTWDGVASAPLLRMASHGPDSAELQVFALMPEESIG